MVGALYVEIDFNQFCNSLIEEQGKLSKLGNFGPESIGHFTKWKKN